MHVDMRKDKDQLIVSVHGRMDTVSAPDFQQTMDDILNQGEKRIIVDLENLEYISSAGLRSILFMQKKAKSTGGCVGCCSLQTMVKKVFDISGFTGIIRVYDSLEDALKR